MIRRHAAHASRQPAGGLGQGEQGVDRRSTHLCRYSRPSRICLVYTLITDSLKLPNLASSEAMEPPGTYSRKMLSDSSVFSVPCAGGALRWCKGGKLGG